MFSGFQNHSPLLNIVQPAREDHINSQLDNEILPSTLAQFRAKNALKRLLIHTLQTAGI